MITRIPALEFMQRAVGVYQSSDQMTSLQVKKCGYGQILEFRSNNELTLAGVVGAAGSSIELFAQFGLPNVVHMTGELKSESVISFRAQEPPVEMLLALAGDTLTFTISLKGAARSNHVLQRA